MDASRRPPFTGIYEELEQIRKVNPEATLSNPNRAMNSPQLRSNPSSLNLIKPHQEVVSGPEVNVTRVFGNNVKKKKNFFNF